MNRWELQNTKNVLGQKERDKLDKIHSDHMNRIKRADGRYRLNRL